MKALLVILTLFTLNFVMVGTCNDLVNNCIDTATEAYEEGAYNEAQLHMFSRHICPNAGLECLADQ